ncbi:eukaryotic translation initiation factor 4B-like isoform X1 [Alosa pseudoharengus]|uniref:eukaryotic translation initiation factor 4B-like isoform X1 n=1 Tax=Alosa pseudoharengus TaxID=34774 RepID=UPI003F8BA9AD
MSWRRGRERVESTPRVLSGKKKNKKGKTLTLTDFLAADEKSSGSPAPSFPAAKATSWADETDDLDGDVSTSWHTAEDSYRGPPIDRSILPTAPRAAREPDVDRSRLPRSPPYTAFLGNLPYDVTEESIKNFFRGLAISAVRLPREPSNPERLKGFGYAEFDDVDSILQALTFNEENLGNRRVRVDIADQSNDKERDNGSMMGRDRDRGGRGMDGPANTDSDWRARPSSDVDDGPRRDDSYGERSRDRYESDRFRDGPRRDDSFGGGRDGGRDGGRFRDRYDDRGPRDFDRGGFDSGGGRRAFGSGFRRDDDFRRDEGRSGGDRFGDRYGDREERSFERREERSGGAPLQRPKLNLKPRSVPKDEGEKDAGESTPPTAPSGGSRASSIFGAAKPVDTAAKEREVEERLKKEQEKLQRQLEDDKFRGERDRRDKPQDKEPSWRSEKPPKERSRTGSDSTQPARVSRRRESERSVENEVFSGQEDEPPSSRPSASPTSQDVLPLKVMPAPPPKENAWAKRSTGGGTSEGESRAPVSPTGGHPPKSSSSSADERGSGKDENKLDGVRRDRGAPRGGRGGGPAGFGAGRGRGEGPNRDKRREPDRKESKKERDPRAAPEPKKYEETPAPKFSSASKYAALLMDGDQGDDEDVE